jgi:hypothetical protein
VKLPDTPAPAPLELGTALDLATVEMLAESPATVPTEPALAVQDCGG